MRQRIAAPVYYGTNLIDRYNGTKDRAERVRFVGSDRREFVWDADPAQKQEWMFLGLDRNAVNNMITAGAPLRYVSAGGAGTISDLSQLHGGIELATAAVLNDSLFFQTGGTNPNYVFNVSQAPFFMCEFYIPAVTEIVIRIALWADANNFIGVRLNTAVDGNLYFVTRSGGVETPTSLGAAAAQWYRIYMGMTATSCWCVLGTAAGVAHAANIPGDNLSVWAYVETLNVVGANKALRLRRMRVLQDAPA